MYCFRHNFCIFSRHFLMHHKCRMRQRSVLPPLPPMRPLWHSLRGKTGLWWMPVLWPMLALQGTMSPTNDPRTQGIHRFIHLRLCCEKREKNSVTIEILTQKRFSTSPSWYAIICYYLLMIHYYSLLFSNVCLQHSRSRSWKMYFMRFYESYEILFTSNFSCRSGWSEAERNNFGGKRVTGGN